MDGQDEIMQSVAENSKSEYQPKPEILRNSTPQPGPFNRRKSITAFLMTRKNSAVSQSQGPENKELRSKTYAHKIRDALTPNKVSVFDEYEKVNAAEKQSFHKFGALGRVQIQLRRKAKAARR